MRFFILIGKGRRQLREETSVWLARLKRGLRQGEGAALRAWLKRRSHRMAIARAAVEWHGPEVVALLAAIFPIPPAILEPRRERRQLSMVTAAAIAICVTVAVPVVVILTVDLHLNRYTTAPGVTRRLTLSDGTLVELNGGAQISVIYGARARSVSVERGEALFKVVSDPRRSFYLHGAGRNFETQGATFDVRVTAPRALEIAVLAGSVTAFRAFAPPHPDDPPVLGARAGQPILIEPRQLLLIEVDQESGQALTQQDVLSRLSWQRGI